MTCIKDQLENVLSGNFTMTENGINGTGITIAFFEGEDVIDIFYSQNDTPIDQITFVRSDMTDEQALELCVKAITALVTTNVRGDHLQHLVLTMKVDGLNPGQYDIITGDIIKMLMQSYEPACDYFFSDNKDRRLKIYSKRNHIVVEVVNADLTVYTERLVMNDNETAENFTRFVGEIVDVMLDEEIEFTDLETVVDKLVAENENSK